MGFFRKMFGNQQKDAAAKNEEQQRQTPLLAPEQTPAVSGAGRPFVPTSTNGMLTENDVIGLVMVYLKAHGYEIVGSANTNQTGVDIIARSHEPEPHELHIEAKGATSSKDSTSRAGLGFTDSQQLDHISKAIYASMKAYSGHRTVGWQKRKVAIALPVTKFHERHIERIRPALHDFGIAVYWVSPKGEVTVE